MDILDAAWVRSLEITYAPRMVDNCYHLVVYYLNAFEQQRKAMLDVHHTISLFLSTAAANIDHVLRTRRDPPRIGRQHPAPDPQHNTTQLAVSRHWPDSEAPQLLEQIKVIVNVAGAAMTTLVAVLNRWSPKRMLVTAEAEAAALAPRAVVDATETTALLGGQSGPHLKREMSTERWVGEDKASVT